MICVRTTIDFFNLLYFVCTVQSGHDYNGSEWKWHCILCMANLCICACSRLLWALRKIHNNVHFNFKVNNAVNKSLFMAFFFFSNSTFGSYLVFYLLPLNYRQHLSGLLWWMKYTRSLFLYVIFKLANTIVLSLWNNFNWALNSDMEIDIGSQESNIILPM